MPDLLTDADRAKVIEALVSMLYGMTDGELLAMRVVANTFAKNRGVYDQRLTKRRRKA